MVRNKDISTQIIIIYFLLLAFAGVIIYRLFYIQIAEAPELKQKAKTQEIREFVLKAAKGSILADKGELLATSIPVFEIRMDVANSNVSDELFRQKVDSLALRLGQLFGKSKSYFKNKLVKARRKGNRYLRLAKNVSYNDLKKLRTFPILRRGKMRGGLIEIRSTIRKHPYGSLAERTIGYETKDKKVGIEGAYANMLNGKDGKQLKRRINNGDWVPILDKNDIEPQDGYDVITTIDVLLQDVAEEALRRQLIKHDAQMGCAVIMEVKTGDVKAISNLIKDNKSGLYKERYNMAINKKIEPGSTFKLASLMAALEDGKLKMSDTVDCSKGYAVYYGRVLRDVHPVGNGPIPVIDVFKHSSNVGVSKLIWRLYKNNPAQFVNRLYAMRLNKKLGIELLGEAKPKIKHPKLNKKEWYGTSLPWMSVGYEVELTPLQILTFYNAVANNGIMMKPRFVTEIKDGGLTVKKIDTVVLNPHIASASTIKAAQKMLQAVVEENGTGKKLKNEHFKIAGKTGTAKISGNGGYIKGAYNATFVGYFPADNPRYSCIVVVNKPKKNGYYGAAAAAPVFKEIADKIYATSLAIFSDNKTSAATKDIPLPKSICISQNAKEFYKLLGIPVSDFLKNDEWVRVKKQNHNINLDVVEPPQDKIPDVRGMNAKDAVFLLENLGLKTTVKGRGTVKSQSLQPGSEIPENKKITLKMSII